ncbi:hypothetical protein BGW39_006721 [Mortierella sp. 14UC]|nr:hypothetical protein BGW39_006721 [Mortierella sp. 14UC]
MQFSHRASRTERNGQADESTARPPHHNHGNPSAGTEGREINKEGREGGQDVGLSQSEATRTPMNNRVSGVAEDGQKRRVSPGSFTEASESNIKKFSRSLSVDMELYSLGRRSAQGSVPLHRQAEATAGQGTNLSAQRNHDELRQAPEAGGDDERMGSPETMDVERSGQADRDFPSTKEVLTALSVFAATATRLGGPSSAGVLSNGTRTDPDGTSRGHASTDKNAAMEHASDSRQPLAGVNDSSFVLGEEGYYSRSDLEALYARWEEEFQSSKRFGDTNSMEQEDGEGSQEATLSKGKARKQNKLRDNHGRKRSKSGRLDEVEDEDEGEEDVDDDEDEDDDEAEEDEDEAGKGQGRAGSASRSSKRKRPGNGEGKGKGKTGSEGKKRKKLKSAEDTRKHPCSKPHKGTPRFMVPTEEHQTAQMRISP